jgi:hypothetical protein
MLPQFFQRAALLRTMYLESWLVDSTIAAGDACILDRGRVRGTE